MTLIHETFNSLVHLVAIVTELILLQLIIRNMAAFTNHSLTVLLIMSLQIPFLVTTILRMLNTFNLILQLREKCIEIVLDIERSGIGSLITLIILNHALWG